MTILHPTSRNELRWLLNNFFNDAELRELCFELAISYENLPGQAKREKIIELISYCERHGQISTLLSICRRLRPFVDWPSEPEATGGRPVASENANIRQPQPLEAGDSKKSNRSLLIMVILALCLCCALYAVVIFTINNGCLLIPPLNELLPDSIRC